MVNLKWAGNDCHCTSVACRIILLEDKLFQVTSEYVAEPTSLDLSRYRSYDDGKAQAHPL